ncbi:MAG: CHAD domain-containing protein, partial [Acidimicrobiales bacterium]
PPSEVIHQARVAARRLRSDLLTLRPVLDHLWIDHTRAELAWLGTVLGAVRDVDVLAGNLDLGDTARPDDDAGRSELDGRLGRQREAALTEVACALDDERYIDLLDRIHGASTLPPFSAAGGRHGPAARAADVLPSLVRRQWWKVRRRVHRAGRHPSDRQLHRIRIGAKQLRYAAEMATPVVGPPARRTARAAERLQDLLGRHHDAVTADAWLRGEARRATPAGSFTAGLLSGVQRRRQRRYRRRWSGAWARLGDRKRHRWLRS